MTQAGVNGWCDPTRQSCGMSTHRVNVEEEIVRAILSNSKEVELAVETIGTEDDPPFIPFDNRHTYLVDEVVKSGISCDTVLDGSRSSDYDVIGSLSELTGATIRIDFVLWPVIAFGIVTQIIFDCQ